MVGNYLSVFLLADRLSSSTSSWLFKVSRLPFSTLQQVHDTAWQALVSLLDEPLFFHRQLIAKQIVASLLSTNSNIQCTQQLTSYIYYKVEEGTLGSAYFPIGPFRLPSLAVCCPRLLTPSQDLLSQCCVQYWRTSAYGYKLSNALQEICGIGVNSDGWKTRFQSQVRHAAIATALAGVVSNLLQGPILE